MRIMSLTHDGYWTAELVEGDFRATVDDRYGSWQTAPDENGRNTRSDA